MGDDELTARPGPGIHPELVELATSFTPRVERVGERVYVAIGYGLANTVLIDGDDGVIVVDVLESVEAAADARDALRAHAEGPVRAVVYTHGHPDHVWGGPAWLPDGPGPDVEILAHESVPHLVHEFANVLAPRYVLGAMHMYGNLLEDGPTGFVVNGIGPRLNAGRRRGFLPPTRTFATEDEVEIAGVRMQLVFAPGESPDQIFVWLPDDRVLLSGDTVYRSFPNIYTIRGARFRDPRDWYASVDKLRAFPAEHLVPCHGGPVHGRTEVADTLQVYRDAIQYVFDQTVRGMNAGRSPTALARSIELPSDLVGHPYLRPLYGQVDLCVREIFAGLYGWFGGSSAELVPIDEDEESAEIIALAGGVSTAADAVAAAVADGRLPWAVRLGTHVLRVDPERRDVQDLVATALEQQAFETPNANLRNWFLTDARVVRGILPLDAELATRVAAGQGRGVASGVPSIDLVRSWSVRLDPEAAPPPTRVRLTVPDEPGGPLVVVLALRHGVCVVEVGPDADRSDVDLDVHVTRGELLAVHTGDRAWTDVPAGRDARWLAVTAAFDGWSAAR